MTRCRRLTTEPASLRPRWVTTALVAAVLSVSSLAAAQAPEADEQPVEAPPGDEQGEITPGESDAAANETDTPDEVAPPPELPPAPPADEIAPPPEPEKKAAPVTATLEATEPEVVLE